jgi:pseudouridine-5'-phosphate glycosidase
MNRDPAIEPPLRVHPEVRAALDAGRPVVALETAVLTHGLPRDAMAAPPCASVFLRGIRGWRSDQPANLELARAMAEVVRAAGAVPATIGMLDGTIVVGLDDDELAALGRAERPLKLSSRDLAIGVATRAAGGTTVAGTLAALRILRAVQPRSAISVFATGGIGGVHRGWTERPDASADLLELARSPVCVVSAGAKSILDLDATVEALDTLGVVVLGLGTRWFPRFLTVGAPPLAVQHVVPSVEAAAAICTAHWSLAGVSDGGSRGVLLANPPPEAFALPIDAIESIIAAAVRTAADEGVAAAEVTPRILAAVAGATGGASVGANVAALLANAKVGAAVSVALARAATM